MAILAARAPKPQHVRVPASHTMTLFTAPAFFSGLVLSLSLIMAIGPQNAHVMRMGLKRQHLWLTIAVCVATDIVLIAAGVGGLARLGGLSDKLLAVTFPGSVGEVLGLDIDMVLQPDPIDWSHQKAGLTPS